MTAGNRTTSRRLPVVIALAVAACMTSVAEAAVRYPTGAEIVAKLNAQRAAHGLPVVAEDPARAQGCAAHNHYVAVNGEDPANPHQETPGKPAYTPAGDQAARTSNLGGSAPFFSVWEDGNPYEDAPYHLADLLDPLAVGAGGAESEGYNCIGTARDPGRTSPGSDTFFTYPGNGKPIPWFEVTVNEFPRTPGEVVGIPAGTVTGPYLIAYWDGPPTDPLDVLADATLTGPDGAVPVRIVGLAQDGESARSGFVIPTTPLRPASAYSATVTFATGSSATMPRRATHTFGFVTTGAPAPAQLVKVVTGASSADGLVHIALHTRSPLNVQSGCTIAVKYSSGTRVPTASGPCATGNYRELAYRPPAAAAWMTFAFTTPAFRIGAVSFPATRTTRTIKGPALSTVISRIGLKRSYRYARIRAGLPVTLTLRRPGRLQVGVFGTGTRLLGASRVRRVRAGKVTVRVPLSPVLATRRRTRATVEIRFAPDKQAQLKVRRQITITR